MYKTKKLNHLLCTSSKLTPIDTTLYRFKMTGPRGSRGAARDFWADPHFIMREANSPPQGTKRCRGNKSSPT